MIKGKKLLKTQIVVVYKQWHNILFNIHMWYVLYTYGLSILSNINMNIVWYPTIKLHNFSGLVQFIVYIIV